MRSETFGVVHLPPAWELPTDALPRAADGLVFVVVTGKAHYNRSRITNLQASWLNHVSEYYLISDAPAPSAWTPMLQHRHMWTAFEGFRGRSWPKNVLLNSYRRGPAYLTSQLKWAVAVEAFAKHYPRPGLRWLAFFDDDSFVVVPRYRQRLSVKDPSKPVLAGRVGRQFGCFTMCGGCGVSMPLVRLLSEQYLAHLVSATLASGYWDVAFSRVVENATRRRHAQRPALLSLMPGFVEERGGIWRGDVPYRGFRTRPFYSPSLVSIHFGGTKHPVPDVTPEPWNLMYRMYYKIPTPTVQIPFLGAETGAEGQGRRHRKASPGLRLLPARKPRPECAMAERRSKAWMRRYRCQGSGF